MLRAASDHRGAGSDAEGNRLHARQLSLPEDDAFVVKEDGQDWRYGEIGLIFLLKVNRHLNVHGQSSFRVALRRSRTIDSIP